jgi:hypothetical protein
MVPRTELSDEPNEFWHRNRAGYFKIALKYA